MKNKDIKINATLSKYPIRPLTKQRCMELSAALSVLNNTQRVEGISPLELKEYINDGFAVLPAFFDYKKQNDNKQYTRSKDNFTSINIMLIDVDNEETVYYNDPITNKKKTKKIKFLVGDPRHISIEQAKKALKELELDYFLIYKTLSYTEKQEKYRIGFILPEIIEQREKADLIYQRICKTLEPLGVKVDSKALECSRLFFPGEVVELHNNILDISKLKEIQIKEEKEKPKKAKIKENTKNTNTVTVKIKGEVPQKQMKNIEKEDIIDYINSVVQEITAIDVANRYEELNKIIQLEDLLNIKLNEKFNCIFHTDNNPSSEIYWDHEQHTGVYHCHGCDIRLNGVQFIKKVLNFGELDFIKFLENNTQIRIGSAYQKEALKISQWNINYLLNQNGLEKDSEIVFKYLRRRNLLLLLDTLYVLSSFFVTLEPLSVENGVTFFSSIGYIANFYNRRVGAKLDEKNIRNKINTLAQLCLIEKLEFDKLSPKAKANCIAWKQNNKGKKYSNFFNLKQVNFEMLKKAEDIILHEKEIGVKAKNTGKKQATISLGVENANSVYNQYTKKIELEKEKLYKDTVDYLKNLDKQYFTLDDVVKNIDLSYNYKKAYKIKQVEIYLTKLVKENLVKKVRCSKQNKDLYSIPDTYTPYNSVFVLLNEF